jgi:hypothetical protein
MRLRTTLAAAAVLVAGALLGWVVESRLLSTALAQNNSALPTGGIQLPMSDRELQGKVGETFRDSTPS